MAKTIDKMSLSELRAWRPREADMATIREMAFRLAQVADPEKIVLFGSYARGDATKDSDIDFLVIQRSSLPRPLRSIPLYSALRYYPFAVEVVVYTPEEVERFGSLGNSFVATALREGKVLYEKRPRRATPGLAGEGQK